MIGAAIGGFVGGLQSGMQMRRAITGASAAPINQGGRSIGAMPDAGLSRGSGDSGAPPTGGFGSLSAKYESGGKSSTIAYDKTGGWSYGRYQFVGGGKTADGSSMRTFLDTLKTTDPEAYSKLEAAGGFGGARSGSSSFKSAWKEVSSRPGFQEAEAQNARNTLFTPAVETVKRSTGLDVSQRSPALQEVLFSTAIQHGAGGSASLWRNALKGADVGSLTDQEIITRLYDERSNVGRYFKSSDPKIQQAVADRFKRERQDALALLTGPSSTQASPPRPTGIPAISDDTSQAPQQWGLLQQLLNSGGA